MKKRLLSIFMAATMAIGLLPSAAYAEDHSEHHDHVHERAKIQLGGTQLLGEQVDRLYFGNYMQSRASDGTFPKEPIKWRVLEDDGNELFMISDQNLDIMQYHTENKNVWWNNSTIRSWLNGYKGEYNLANKDYSASTDNFLDIAFTEKEQKAIATSNLQNEEGEANTQDKIFLLSYAEAENRKYFHADTLHGDYALSPDESRQATNTDFVANKGTFGQGNPFESGKSNQWWLRSSGTSTNYAAAVLQSGNLLYGYSGIVNGWEYAVRPALRLDLDKILFVSAAEGAKAGADSGLQKVMNTTKYDWKPTLLDSTRSFTADVVSNLVDKKKAVIQPGGTVNIAYTGAQMGVHEYISVIIADEHENALYYGRVRNITTDDVKSAAEAAPFGISIPNTLGEGDYKMKIFNEQYNGSTSDTNKKPDYASKFTEIALTVDGTAPVLSVGNSTRYAEKAATVVFDGSESGTCYYYVTDDINEALPTASDLKAKTGVKSEKCFKGYHRLLLENLTNSEAKKIFIVLEDEAGNLSNVEGKEIPKYVAPTEAVYRITSNTPTLIFNPHEVGYKAEDLQEWEVPILNVGTEEVKLEFVEPAADTQLKYFQLSSVFEPASIAAGKTAKITVRPKWGLPVGEYEETIKIQGVDESNTDNKTNEVEIKLTFEVTAAPQLFNINVSVNPPEGGVAMGGKKYLEGERVLLSAQANSGYRFGGWTEDGVYLAETSNELSFDATGDRTLVAQFKPIQNESSGGGGGSAKPKEEPKDEPKDEPEIKPEEKPAEPDTNEREEEQPVLPVKLPFADVAEEDWFYEAIAEAYRSGQMTGTSATAFSPYDEITRAMTVNVFWRLAGQPDHGTESHYPDVASDQWYSRGLAWATLTDVAHGYENGHFGPHDPVTREQMAAFFHRWAAYNNHGLTARDDLSDFTDADRVSGWARESVEWAVGNGLLVGRDGKRLDPTTPVTRAEFAAMLQRYLVAVEGISAETAEAILEEEML